MKIFVSHSLGWDYPRLLYAPLMQSALSQRYQWLLPYLDKTEPYNTRSLLKKCDGILAEVSYPSTEQGLELSWGQLVGIPVIGFCQAGKTYSPVISLITENIFTYHDTADLIHQVETHLDKIKG